MPELSVMIPDDRVPKFYELVGRFLAGEFDGVPDRPLTGSNMPKKPWQLEDTEQAVEVWEKLSQRAKSLFGVLLEQPNVRFSALKLAEQLEIPHGRFGVAGTLAWPGRHCYAVGRELPVNWKELDEDTEYWMNDLDANVFRIARDGEQ